MMKKLAELIPDEWRDILKYELVKPYWNKLAETIAKELKTEAVFPSINEIFYALKLTPYSEVKVLILGQDPYHDHNQAHGLCFSVQDGTKIPPSLKNIYKELYSDLDIPISERGDLTNWAEQGILMLNTSLTVRAHQAASHSKIGWINFTDAVINAVNSKKNPVIFVLWGRHAIEKEKLIDTSKHFVIKSAHPSPLSAYRGFLGSRPFSQINILLVENGYKEINWQIAEQTKRFELIAEFL